MARFDETTGKWRKYVRRAIGVTVCLSPGLLLLASLGYAATSDTPANLRAIGAVTVGLLIAGFNFYLSFVRPWRFKREHGSLAEYRHVSGTPMIGSMIVVFAAFVSFGDWMTALLGLLAFAIDTGGTLWFLIAMRRDPSFWDGG